MYRRTELDSGISGQPAGKSVFLESKKESSEEKNVIMDTDGQVEDYFNADKNPFQRIGGGDNSLDENSFFVQGAITQQRSKDK